MPFPPAPMLATAGQLPAEAHGWVAEAKLDGARAAARVYGGGAQLFSRPGNHLSARFPEVTAALATALDGRRAILDGEIVTLDRRSGVPRFELLQRRLAVAHPRFTLQARIPASLWVFDVLHLDGADLTQLPYQQRRAILEELPLGASKAIAVPPVWPDLAGDVLLDVMRELSLEGVIMKRADSTYQPGRRSKSWVKSVLRRRAAAVICGWVPGSVEPVGSLVVGAHNASGDLVFCGAVSSGLSRKARMALHLQPLGAVAIAIVVHAGCHLIHANPYLAAFAAGSTLATLDEVAATRFQPFGELLSEGTKFLALLVFGALITPERPGLGRLAAGNSDHRRRSSGRVVGVASV